MGIRSYPDKPRVYLDMDGVLADFQYVMDMHQLPASKLKVMPGVYRTLPIYPGAFLGVHSLMQQGFELFVLTKIPDENLYAATEKLLWVQEYFPELHGRVIISPDKGCVGSERDYLVDDYPEWANVSSFRGTVLHFGSRGVHADWDSILKYFKELA